MPFLGGLRQHTLPRLDVAIVELEGRKLTDVWVHAVLCVQHLQEILHRLEQPEKLVPSSFTTHE